ncbi:MULTISPECIES: hypothetical protein [unclassified Nocardioides]|uniref:hypothetical protein n=1 Tax=unclassified Nocardioides TaxID=2615069 RepID=UPI000A9AE1B0|nr:MULTISPECIES: hypothetical protein [unclassified Nocardioides]
MSKRVTVVVVAVVGLALLAALAVVGVHWWRDRDTTAFAQAASYAPADAARLSWTDWAAVRGKTGADLDATSSADDVQGFLDDAFDQDLTSASALVQSAPVLQAHFGFSPANVEWELFSQSTAGAVVILRLPDDDLDAVGDDLEDAGFTRPGTEDGVWIGGDSLLPEIGADLSPELQYVALDADRGLVLTSDRSDYLQQVVDGMGDDHLSDPVRSVVEASGEPVTAAVYDGDNACSTLAMSQADADDQATADRLVEEAGTVDPMTAYALSVQPGGHVRAVMAFASDDQARTNAASRAALAAGPAPGQGGDFTDRFSVGSATAEGDLVTLDLVPRSGEYVFSDLSSGPVLFATC